MLVKGTDADLAQCRIDANEEQIRIGGITRTANTFEGMGIAIWFRKNGSVLLGESVLISS